MVLVLVFLKTSYAQNNTPWQNKKCDVVLTYDDALNVHIDNVVPLLDSLGFKGTFYLSGFFPSFREQMNDWKTVAAKGYELGNHTFFHPCEGNRQGRECVKADYDLNTYSVQRISINEDWRFYKYDSTAKADDLIYDVRPEVKDRKDDGPADAKPTEAVGVKVSRLVLKPWILPTGNDFIKEPSKHHVRPEGNPGNDFPFVQNNFDDSSWESVNLPHDWAIKGPFIKIMTLKLAAAWGAYQVPVLPGTGRSSTFRHRTRASPSSSMWTARCPTQWSG